MTREPMCLPVLTRFLGTEFRHDQSMAVGVVREWHDDEGWGVLDSDETPGGCWAHFSSLSMSGYRRASTGDRVSFTHSRIAQDGFEYVAQEVKIDGVPLAEPDAQPPGPSYMSHLTIEPD